MTRDERNESDPTGSEEHDFAATDQPSRGHRPQWPYEPVRPPEYRQRRRSSWTLGWALLLGGLLFAMASFTFFGRHVGLLPPSFDTADVAVRRIRDMVAEGDRLFEQRTYGSALERYDVALQYLDRLQEEGPLRGTVLVRRKLASLGVSLTQ